MRDGHLLLSVLAATQQDGDYLQEDVGEQIRTFCPIAQPREMLLDFENASINCFEVWPDTLIRWCFFHLTKNIWRKVQAAGMQTA